MDLSIFLTEERAMSVTYTDGALRKQGIQKSILATPALCDSMLNWRSTRARFGQVGFEYELFEKYEEYRE